MARAGNPPAAEASARERLNFVDDSCARGAVDHGNAVEKERGGKRAEQEILERCFVGNHRATAETDQHVGGNRAHLQADESSHELIGACKNSHSGGREQHERVVFTALQALRSR